MISFLIRGDSRRVLYRQHLGRETLFVSFMTLAELERWAVKYSWGGPRRPALEAQLRRVIIWHSNDDLCKHWAYVRTASERLGRPISEANAWQAATALLHDIPLITHNRRHYAAVPGLTVISEAPV